MYISPDMHAHVHAEIPTIIGYVSLALGSIIVGISVAISSAFSIMIIGC